MDRGDIGIGDFIDLKKALDTVDHKYSIEQTNALCNWLQSYLSNRTQCCYVNGVLSGSQIISCGVPQRSILGPLLLFIYTSMICLAACPNPSLICMLMIQI
jgi:hypothetical protein